MRIAIASDHAGFDLKQEIIQYLKDEGYDYQDFGPYDEEAVDFPDFARPVAEAVAKGECERGILICGTGIGMSMAANKIKGARASLCHDGYTAYMTRAHNDANILCIGSRVTGVGVALDIVDVWLSTPFSGMDRHQRRVDKLAALER